MPRDLFVIWMSNVVRIPPNYFHFLSSSQRYLKFLGIPICLEDCPDNPETEEQSTDFFENDEDLMELDLKLSNCANEKLKPQKEEDTTHNADLLEDADSLKSAYTASNKTNNAENTKDEGKSNDALTTNELEETVITQQLCKESNMDISFTVSPCIESDTFATSHKLGIKKETISADSMVDKNDKRSDVTNEDEASHARPDPGQAPHHTEEYDHSDDVDLDFGPLSPEPAGEIRQQMADPNGKDESEESSELKEKIPNATTEESISGHSSVQSHVTVSGDEHGHVKTRDQCTRNRPEPDHVTDENIMSTVINKDKKEVVDHGLEKKKTNNHVTQNTGTIVEAKTKLVSHGDTPRKKETHLTVTGQVFSEKLKESGKEKKRRLAHGSVQGREKLTLSKKQKMNLGDSNTHLNHDKVKKTGVLLSETKVYKSIQKPPTTKRTEEQRMKHSTKEKFKLHKLSSNDPKKHSPRKVQLLPHSDFKATTPRGLSPRASCTPKRNKQPETKPTKHQRPPFSSTTSTTLPKPSPSLARGMKVKTSPFKITKPRQGLFTTKPDKQPSLQSNTRRTEPLKTQASTKPIKPRPQFSLNKTDKTVQSPSTYQSAKRQHDRHWSQSISNITLPQQSPSMTESRPLHSSPFVTSIGTTPSQPGTRGTSTTQSSSAAASSGTIETASKKPELKNSPFNFKGFVLPSSQTTKDRVTTDRSTSITTPTEQGRQHLVKPTETWKLLSPNHVTKKRPSPDSASKTQPSQSLLVTKGGRPGQQSPGRATYQVVRQRDVADSDGSQGKMYVCDVCHVQVGNSRYSLLLHKADYHWM